MLSNPFTEQVGIQYPIICGPMYPCSNPELVAAVSKAGGLGVIQPVSMEYVHGHPLREGIQLIREITSNPVGMNALIESSSKSYEKRVHGWIELALEEGIRFFITSLGNPRWVVDLVKPHGGLVYHDVVNFKHAKKAKDAGVDGIIGVNNRAGGHAGGLSAQALYDELKPLGLPLICAGGVARGESLAHALKMGYVAVQMGTRFIATTECTAHQDYKEQILKAQEKDIVHTERVTGVPLAVIRTPYIDRIGTKAGPLARWMLRGRTRKKIMRTIYFFASGWAMKRSTYRPVSSKDYLQAGKSVADIHKIEPAETIIKQLTTEAQSGRNGDGGF